MPKKESAKIDRDDLIDAITDGRVIQALIKSLLVELRPATDDIVRAHVEQLEAALNEKIEDSVNKEVERQTKELRVSVVELKRESESLKERLDQLESYSKARGAFTSRRTRRAPRAPNLVGAPKRSKIFFSIIKYNILKYTIISVFNILYSLAFS